MHGTQKGSIGITALIVVIVVVAGVLGYMSFFNNEQPTPANNDQLQNNNNDTPSDPIEESDPLDDWIVYTNEQFGFSLKHLRGFEQTKEEVTLPGTNDEGLNVVFSRQSPPDTNITVHVNPFFGTEGYADYKNPKQVTIDGVAAELFFNQHETRRDNIFLVASPRENGNTYSVRLFSNDGANRENWERTFEDVLSSFTFTQ